MPVARLPLRVQLDQLRRQLLDGLARPRLEQLPRLAAELRQRGRLRVGADVARHLAELLVRDVQAVLAAEREQQVVARDAGDLLRLEAEQLADAVVLVDDVVAGAEVGERLERAAADPALARDAAAEDLVVGQQHEPELAPDEAAAGRRDREQDLRLVRDRVARLEHPRLDLAQHVLGAQRLAAVRERDDDALPRADERRQLVLRLGEPARGDRRPLRLERELLSLRERVELGRAVERDRLEPVLLPDPAHVVRLEDEVGAARERRHEVVRHRPRLALFAVPLLDEVEAALDGRIDDRLLHRVQRALRERREGADRLDLVAEELDAERLASRRREDVDRARRGRRTARGRRRARPARSRRGRAPPTVPRRRSPVRRELERLGPRLRRRQRLRERVRGRADEPAAGEHVERARPLAHEMRRRLEPGLPADAAARHEPDQLVAEEPRRRLGRVARVGVLRQKADERPAELLVQRREHDRQRRLGHARPRRQRVRELAEALVLDELLGRRRGVPAGP